MRRTAARSGGYTLVEMSVVLAISGLLLTGMVGILFTQVRIPLKIQSDTAGSAQVRKATLLITEDANNAQSFTAGTSTVYGTFKWTELSGAASVPVSVRYLWQNQELLREVTHAGETGPPQVVMKPVATSTDVLFSHTPSGWTYSDITKTWTYTEGRITVTATSTRESAPGLGDVAITAKLIGDLRPQTDRPVPLPGRLPPPVPPANQVNFYVAGNPTLNTGTYRSGSGSNLKFDDTLYYVTRGAGSPRTVEWEVTSEVIDYATTTQISIEFTGQVDTSGVAQSFFVYNPNDPEHTQGGYAVTPDESSVYPSVNTDRTITFQLNDADVAYVNSLGSKVVRLKMVATSASSFDHTADRLIFRVAGNPNPTFFRDYVADTAPTVELGSGSGNFTSLSADDDDYYTITRDSGTDTVQWQAISEAINLDTLSSLEIRFQGKATKQPVAMSFFIFNPNVHSGDGFPVAPNATTTYSTSAEVLTSFFLNATDLAYVSSLFPKEVRIRVKGTLAQNWDLNSDLLLFRAKP